MDSEQCRLQIKWGNNKKQGVLVQEGGLLWIMWASLMQIVLNINIYYLKFIVA